MATNKEEGIADEVLDRLLEGRDPATVFESGGLVDELKKRLAERMLNAEMDHHLGGDRAGSGQSPQRLRGQDGPDGQQQAGAVDTARSARAFRPGADWKVPAAVCR